MSQLGQFQFLEILETITGNTGDIVHPQVGNINILGAGHITINGNNTTATLNVTLDGGVADTYTEDAGSNVVPVLGVVNVLGGDNINTFGAGNTITINLDESIVLPVTSSDGLEGLYSLGSNRFMHARGTLNTFLGQSAGSLALTVATAVNNVGLGANALTGIVTSTYTTATGADSAALLSGGSGNSFYGSGSGSALVSGSNNTLISKDAGSAYVSSESSNICIGNIGVAAESNKIRIGTYGTGAGQQDVAYIAGVVHCSNGMTVDTGDAVLTSGNLKLPTTSATVGQVQINSVPVLQTYGTHNTFLGADAGNFTLTVANASNNVGVGAGALNDLVGTAASQGYANVALGSYALSTGTEIAGCIALGYNSGTNYTTTENSNIVINNLGVTGESNVLRFGAGTGTTLGKLNKAFISGIYGISVGATAGVTITDSTDQVGTISGTEGQVLRMGASKPAFSTATYPNTVAKGDIIAATADNVIGVITGATTSGYVLTANGTNTVPTFQALPSSGISILEADDADTASGSTVNIEGGTNITTSADDASTLTISLNDSITLSGDVTALNFKTSTVANNLTINGNTITSDGSGSDIDINLVAKGIGGLTFDGIATGWSDSQWHIRQSEVQTTDATSTPLVTISLVEGEMITINATINGFQSDFTDACGATVTLTAYRPTGGNVTQIGEENININSTSTAIVSADVNVGTQSMVISVTGVAAENWNWISTHQYMFTKTNA